MTAPEPTLRDPHLRAQLEQADANDAEARRVAGELSSARLAWRPPEGGWGVGDCLEHLASAGVEYLAQLRPAVERARAGAARTPVYGAWRPSLGGRALIWTVNARMKVPAPRLLRPPPQPRPEVLAAFLDTQAGLRELAAAADGLDLSRVRLASPVTRLLRLNFGDALQVLQDHARRHLAQARRVREHREFPAG